MTKLENKNLYPDGKIPLLEHYSDFDNVYVGLLPFFKLDKEHCNTNSSKKIISLEEAREEDDIFKKIENRSNVTIYSSNESYPNDDEIAQSGKIITWQEVIDNTKFKNYKELNKALMTSIGAVGNELQREGFLVILNEYSEKNDIWHPTEGMFDFFTKRSVYDMLKSNGITDIEVEDEFYENKKIMNLNTLTKNDFCKKIDFQDYYIYTKDNSILFSIGWDYFFFFIAINEKVFSRQAIESHFEGFWANEKDNHFWAWEKDEIDKLLNPDDQESNENKLAATTHKKNCGSSDKTKDSNKNKFWHTLKRWWS